MATPSGNLTELQNTRAVRKITGNIVNQTEELKTLNILSIRKADLGQGTNHLNALNI
jgi:hypothetical protein